MVSERDGSSDMALDDFIAKNKIKGNFGKGGSGGQRRGGGDRRGGGQRRGGKVQRVFIVGRV
jgi:hypothetical protein